MKNKFFTLGFVAFAALQQRFCFAKPAPIPTERKLSLRESYGNFIWIPCVDLTAMNVVTMEAAAAASRPAVGRSAVPVSSDCAADKKAAKITGRCFAAAVS